MRKMRGFWLGLAIVLLVLVAGAFFWPGSMIVPSIDKGIAETASELPEPPPIILAMNPTGPILYEYRKSGRKWYYRAAFNCSETDFIAPLQEAGFEIVQAPELPDAAAEIVSRLGSELPESKDLACLFVFGNTQRQKVQLTAAFIKRNGRVYINILQMADSPFWPH